MFDIWRFYFKMEKVPNFQLFSHQKSPIGLLKQLALILDEIEQKAQVKTLREQQSGVKKFEK